MDSEKQRIQSLGGEVHTEVPFWNHEMQWQQQLVTSPKIMGCERISEAVWNGMEPWKWKQTVL